MAGSASRTRLLILVGLAAILLVVAVVGVKLPFTSGEDAGNGNATSTGAKSLAQVLNGDQQAQLDRASLALDSITQSTGTVSEQAAAAVAACDQLDSSQPMLSALARSCQPYIESAKLVSLISTRCGTPAPCARVFRRLSAILPVVARAEQQFAAQVARAIAPGACADAIKPPAAELAAYVVLAPMAKDAQTALEQDGKAAAVSAIEQFAARAAEADDGKTPLIRIDEQRRACGIKPATDAPG